ncbi:unnamed protein product [Menidia menidia]|uniref:(Atlantic silverside) hypothetical protein n=1 Tax=Menidia menidia TaxID=238744 RepID=A0A8S4B4T9_9TELE|nr:unnamed protein product [Menidia menidia]
MRTRLKEYGLVTPFSTDSHGHYLSNLLSAAHKQRVKREASPPPSPGGGGGGGGGGDPEQRLFFNISAFGREFHLRLRPNERLVAPGAMVEWHDQVPGNHSVTTETTEDGGIDGTNGTNGTERILRRELLKTDCTFIGDITDVPGASVAINNCDGLAILEHEEQNEVPILN